MSERPQGPLDRDELAIRLADLFRAVGPLYRLAARNVAAMESIEQVSTGVRAVLERLHVAGAEPVPAIARSLGTSRQWVQRMCNEAAARGLVGFAPNPAHRRSQLVELTEDGRATVERILARELAVLARRAPALDEDELAIAIRVLELVAEAIGAEEQPDGA